MWVDIIQSTEGLQRLKIRLRGTSLVAQWLRFHAPNAGGTGSIPGWGTKIPHNVWWGQQQQQKLGKEKKILLSLPETRWDIGLPGPGTGNLHHLLVGSQVFGLRLELHHWLSWFSGLHTTYHGTSQPP